MRLAIAPLALILVLAAGCGGSDDSAAAPSASTAVPATSASAPATEGSGDCGAAQAEIDAAAQVTGYVDAVEVPTCDLATVRTTLGTDDQGKMAGMAVCALAGNEAFSHGVAAVSVVSADGTELASDKGMGTCQPS